MYQKPGKRHNCRLILFSLFTRVTAAGLIAGRRTFDRIFAALLAPKFEELKVALVVFGCVFEIEEGIEKTGGLHKALGLAPLCFAEAELVGHDIADLIDHDFGDANLRADRAEVLIDGFTSGIERSHAFFDLFLDDGFVIFAENEGKEERGVDVEVVTPPAVHLFERLDNPLVALVVLFDPIGEGGEHRANQVGLFEPVIDMFGMTAEKELLHLFEHTRRARLFEERGVAADGVEIGRVYLQVEGAGEAGSADHPDGIFGEAAVWVADNAQQAIL